ncbi:hypothetical protein APP_28070 [Aeribacillus pallidus]|nr:hypothetical protein APP_28070 [Aeribacillus pallidus]
MLIDEGTTIVSEVDSDKIEVESEEGEKILIDTSITIVVI